MPLGGDADGGTIRSVHRLVTAAELRALHTTSVELVTAPGASQVIVPLGFVTTFAPGGIAFNGLDATLLAYGPVPPGEFQITGALSTGAATDTATINGVDAFAAWVANVAGVTPATIRGQPLLLVDASAAGSTQGTGTLAVDVTYAVLTA